MPDNATRDEHIGWADYLVFGITLAMSAAIGFFYAYKDRKCNDMDTFHRGGKKANPLAVSLSLSVTIISALTIIGLPAEVYTYGTMILWEAVGMFIATIVAAHVFLPTFYTMDKISTFEYIQVRFGRGPRIIGSIAYLFVSFIVASFALFAPSLAFEAMTGISVWIVMAVAAFVCMTYTLMGGMKAVVWADTFQFVIIIAGMVCMLAEGSKAVGGFGNAWNIANKHNRIEFFNFSVDPRTRHTVWSLVIGYALIWSNAFGTNQATVQRACSLPSLKIAQIAEWLSFPGLGLIIVLAVLNGIVMFAYYENCDPVTDGRVFRKDQLFPLMIVDVIGDISGLPGLLLACLFSGALSSISSGLNAIAAVVIEDFIKPCTSKPLSDNKQLFISKVCVIIISCFIYGIAGGLSQLGGLIHQLISTTASLFGGPLLGLFLSGVLFPWTNAYGACAGMVGSLALSGWLIFGSLLNGTRPTPLPVSIAGCESTTTMSVLMNATQTTILGITTTTEHIVETAPHVYSAVEEFYRMSYLWFAGFGMLVCLTIALVVSFLTGPTNPKDVDSKLMCPLFYKLCPFLPEKYRKKLMFGVDYSSTGEKDYTANKLDYMSAENGHIAEKVSNQTNEKSPHYNTRI